MKEATPIETDLLDLHGKTLDQLVQWMPEQLEPYRTKLISQVQRPRPNIGTGPPGRAD